MEEKDSVKNLTMPTPDAVKQRGKIGKCPTTKETETWPKQEEKLLIFRL